MARATVAPWAEIAPDLVVEVASPSQSRAEIAEKARRWLRAGTRLVWVIWPTSRQIDVWRTNVVAAPVTLGADDSLDGLDVLPGFHCAIGPLFV